VQVAATTPQAAKGVVAICPDVAKLLAVLALSEKILGFAWLNWMSM
jgi:hypothetical protein